MDGSPVGKKARTQAQLIEAAYAEVLDKGFAAVSLDSIARRAGMTKGAIYSNYRDKAQLLMAVRDAKQPRMILSFEDGAPLERQIEIVADSVIEDLPRTAAAIRFVTDYHSYASIDGEFHDVLEAQYARMFDRGAAFFAAYASELTVSPRMFVEMLQTQILGLMHQSILTPGVVTPAFVRTSFRAILDGVRRR
jgi:AcrR family transcriptional regulator